ncbi:MAG: hypothetical protein IAG13_15480 [Deltaproteobacteria bacterium]|nr:hypothetical protein [Nannocystaceae bacterium]
MPILLYDFCEGAGTSVESITDVKFELLFENGTLGDGFDWVDDGLLLDGHITEAHTALRSYEHAFERFEACRDGGRLTLEVWATPRIDSQGGPTGIAVLGPPPGVADSPNFGLFMNPEWAEPGYVAALRTSTGNGNMSWHGTPYLQPNHLVLVHDLGLDSLYLDGEVIATEPHDGDLSSWNPNHDLVLGNRSDNDVRNWQGTYHLVAVYCEALTSAQVMTNFAAGHRP